MGITMKKSEQRSSHAVMCLWWLIYSNLCHNVIFWKPTKLWLPKSSVMKYPKVIPLLCREAFVQSLSPCRGVSLANPSLAICPQKCHCHLDTEPCMTRPCVPFVWDIQVQSQISLSCPRSQLHSFCGLLWNVPVKNALAICAKHVAFHLTNSSAFRIQLRDWKISVWWELLWYIITILGFLWRGSQPSRPLRISSLSYRFMSFQSPQTEIKTWKYLSPWHSQDTKSVDLGPD